MGVNHRTIQAPTGAVWAVLSDGFSYGDWVVGTSRIRRVDGCFPAVGTRLHYQVGRRPLRHDGHTEVLACSEGRRLVLEAYAWPLGAARIALELTPVDEGCSVRIDEAPSQGLGKTIHNPLSDAFIRIRNKEALRRLDRLATARHREKRPGQE